MSNLKKYKLFSASGGTRAPCAFFNTPGGCRHGDSCKFAHETPGARAVKSEADRVLAEAGSVISTESESDDQKFHAPSQKSSGKSPAKAKPEFEDGEVEEEEEDDHDNDTPFVKKKKARRGKRSEDNLPFAMPKKKAKLETAVTTPPNNNNNNKKNSAPASSSNTKKRAAIDFRSLNLPIAAPTTTIAKKEISSKNTENSKKEVSKRVRAQEEGSDGETRGRTDELDVSKLPLPKSNPRNRKWLEAVKKTRSHPSFVSDFNFERCKVADEEAGICPRTGWIKARSYGDWCADAPQSIAIDCEMCETKDPVSGKKNSKALCRISIVDGETKEVLLDTLVKPAWPVTDYRSWINGIKAEDLEKVQFTIRHAQAFMMALCSEETVIIGHSVNNDLAAIHMEHYCVADSAYLFAYGESDTACVSLRNLAATVLQEEMPDIHDSVNDARTALMCMEHYLEKGGDVVSIERLHNKTADPNAKPHSFYASQLFVHRIPKIVDESHIAKLFLLHSSIQPVEVLPIDFGGGSLGRTHVIFQSPHHANLAFDFLDGGKPEPDPSGRMQKRVFLRNKSHIKVRKQAFDNREPNNSNTPNKDSSRRASSG